MIHHVIAAIVFGLLLINGWVILLVEFPFSYLDMLLIAVSIIVMYILPVRKTFLYVVIIVLGYGGFLTGYALFHKVQPSEQMLYVYEHVLLTLFLTFLWVATNYLKNMQEEINRLRKNVKLLEKTKKNTGILTNREFLYEAKGILIAVRRKGEAWFITFEITYSEPYIMENLQEYIERAILAAIRQQFDIVTSQERSIFLILKDTDENGVHVVLERIKGKIKQELNLLYAPFDVSYERLLSEEVFERLKEGMES